MLKIKYCIDLLLIKDILQKLIRFQKL